jgi:Holliday junction resolvase RusA-like endonuclease
MIEADKKIRPWRNAVHAAIAPTEYGTGKRMFMGDVAVTVHFLFERPKAHYGTGRNAGVLKDNAPFYVSRTPDIDKCVRALLDPITEMRVWADDSQVVRLNAVKMYADLGEAAGAMVTIEDAT